MKNISMMLRVSGMVFPIIFLMACGVEESDYEKMRQREDNAIKAYLNTNNITATRDPSGIYYQPLVENPQGKEVSINDVLSIYYHMQTLEGVDVGKTTDSLAPVQFKHDYQSIIPIGIDYGVQLMSNGEKYRFFIPSSMAYGNYSAADYFPSESIFIIDVELVNIQTESQIHTAEMAAIQNYIADNELENVISFPSGLQYKVLEEGNGSKPLDNGKVTFHYERRYLDGTVIERTPADKPVTAWLNDGVVPGLKEGILQMKEGGKSMLIMPSKIAFGESIQVLPTGLRQKLIEEQIIFTKAVPYAPLIYEVELVDVR